jgi:hypothetical protein
MAQQFAAIGIHKRTRHSANVANVCFITSEYPLSENAIDAFGSCSARQLPGGESKEQLVGHRMAQ